MIREEPKVEAPSIRGAPATDSSECGSLSRQVRHDLRSSVGQIIGYSELWLDEIGDTGAVTDIDSLLRDLGRLQAAGQQMLALINEHVDPIGPRARIEGGQPLQAVPLDDK